MCDLYQSSKLHVAETTSRGCLSVCPLSDSHTSSVGTLETVSESVCIGRNRCATYTNHVITIRNHICKLPGCGARGPAPGGLDTGMPVVRNDIPRLAGFVLHVIPHTLIPLV